MRSRRRCSRSKAVTARPAAACHYHPQVGWDFVSVARKVTAPNGGTDAPTSILCRCHRHPGPGHRARRDELRRERAAAKQRGNGPDQAPRCHQGQTRERSRHRRPARAQGRTRPAGGSGAAGAAGVSGLVIVDNAGGQLGAATCPAGKRALGGGAHAFGGNGTGALVSSEPTSDGTGWTATAESVMGLAQTSVMIYAICATVSF